MGRLSLLLCCSLALGLEDAEHPVEHPSQPRLNPVEWNPGRSDEDSADTLTSDIFLERPADIRAGASDPGLRLRGADDQRTGPPTQVNLNHAHWRNPEDRPATVKIFIAILTSAKTVGRLSRYVSEGGACAPNNRDRVARCNGYTDVHGGSDWGNTSSFGELIHYVPWNQYMSPSLQGPSAAECCRNVSGQDGRIPEWPGTASGVSSFNTKALQTVEICSSRHRQLRLSSQYRFLPALAHASAQMMGSESAQWLMLSDDDSLVNVEVLHGLLSSLDHEQKVRHADRRHRRPRIDTAYWP